MKRIAVVNDLSGFGRCSLTAAIPVISAMGHEACPIPTAILSNQTGYLSFHCTDYTECMPKYIDEWKKLGVHFDAILTGYIASEKQADIIGGFIDEFRADNTLVLVDPVMADDGEIYGTYSKKLCDKVKQLSERADVITPNLTELSILCGIDYNKLSKKSENENYLETVAQTARGLLSETLKTVIVTGVKKDGFVHTITVEKDNTAVSGSRLFGGSYSGTGDIFASVICGKLIDGMSARVASETAVRFLEKSIADSFYEKSDRNDGVNFQKYLEVIMNEKQAKNY